MFGYIKRLFAKDPPITIKPSAPPVPIQLTTQAFPTFANARISREWELVNPLLRKIVLEATEYAAWLGWQLLLTCLVRTSLENDALYGGHGDHLTGVHVIGNGADVRTRDQKPSVVAQVASYVNSRWVYDPTRPQMVVALNEGAGVGSSAVHLHVQVHARTVPRETIT
jgi:hypothetical protein